MWVIKGDTRSLDYSSCVCKSANKDVSEGGGCRFPSVRKHDYNAQFGVLLFKGPAGLAMCTSVSGIAEAKLEQKRKT